MERLLIYGYGNPGCQDDGAGIRFTERCERAFEDVPGIHTEINYQLNVEDAYLISGFRYVVFADAALPEAGGVSPPAGDISTGKSGSGFYFYRIQPAVRIAFSTHAMTPQSILGLCEELYSRSPVCYMMHIQGESWDFNAQPTEFVEKNLDDAWKYFKSGGMRIFSKESLIVPQN